ncbi:hypothetical protein FACS1894139_01620 [Planctomycetales bacterium]|nr:hypothetical protein FACS1894139_01620 [Planctomycetales bacterium]
MYREFWGMAARPFTASHSPEWFVPVASAMLALTKIRYAIAADAGVCAVVGAAGVGKSELTRLAVNDFAGNGWATAYLGNPAGPRDEFFGLLLRELDGRRGDANSPLEALTAHITEIAAAGGKILLALDDLHNLTDAAILDDLRMLLNIEQRGQAAISLLLSGQAPLWGKLAAASEFDARVAMRVNLLPFSEAECETYMLQRLKKSGCRRGVFSKKAAQTVAQASGGYAGNINRLCELSLVTAFALGQEKIRPEIVGAAARDLAMPEDAYQMRVYDEVWGNYAAPEKFTAPEEDILATV